MSRRYQCPTSANGICHDAIDAHLFVRWTGFNDSGSERLLAEYNVFNTSRNIEQKLICEHTYITLKPMEATTNDNIERRSFHLQMRLVAPLHDLQFDLKMRYKTRVGTWSEVHNRLDQVAANKPLEKYFEIVDAQRTDANESLAFHIIFTFSNLHYEIKQDRTVASSMTATVKSSDIFCNPLPAMRLPDFTKQGHHPMATLKLDVENQLLHCFPCLLTSQSPVFAAQINRVDQVLQIKTHSHRDVLLLLRLLYPATPERVTASNACQVAMLAGSYQIEHLMDTAERVLCAALPAGQIPTHGALTMFNLGRCHNRARLTEVSVKALRTLSIDALQNQPVFRAMDNETRCALAMAKMQLYEKQAR